MCTLLKQLCLTNIQGYMLSLYNMAQFNSVSTVLFIRLFPFDCIKMYAQFLEFTKGGGSILSINSPTDFQVYPIFYETLHAVCYINYSITSNISPKDVTWATRTANSRCIFCPPSNSKNGKAKFRF